MRKRTLENKEYNLLLDKQQKSHLSAFLFLVPAAYHYQ